MFQGEWETHHEYLHTSGCTLESLFLCSRRTLPAKVPRAKQTSICKLKRFGFFFYFFCQSGPDLHDVDSAAAQFCFWSPYALSFFSVLCGVSCFSSIAWSTQRNVPFQTRQSVNFVFEGECKHFEDMWFGDWSVCFPQNNKRDEFKMGAPLPDFCLPYPSLFIFLSFPPLFRLQL